MAEEKKRIVIVNPQRMQLAESWRRDWVVNAEAGTAINDVLDPAYWSHMSAELTPYDHIEVRLETGEWMLELVVLASGRNWARVHVMHKHDLAATEPAAAPSAKHIVKWRGPQHKHCVVRVADNEVLQTGFDTAETAGQWLLNYEKVTA